MLPTDNTELVCDLLSFIKKNDGPVGAGSIQRYLNMRGYSMAEATVGRLLRDMDDADLTVKKSNQGRSLSKAGEEKLHELEAAKWQGRWTEKFMDAVGTTNNREHLIELMTARRPVEIEVARLAAKNATDEEIADLRKLVESQEQLAQKGKPVTPLDTEFHILLAKMSHNQILEAIVELLRKKQEDAFDIEEVRRQDGHIYNSEHRMILDAITQKDPEMATLTMRRHLGNLLHILKNNSKAGSKTDR
jgi:hypothetical protein